MLTLKEARKSRGTTVAALAKAAGVSRTTYYKYEKDPKDLTVRRAQKICNFLGYGIDEIFFG